MKIEIQGSEERWHIDREKRIPSVFELGNETTESLQIYIELFDEYRHFREGEHTNRLYIPWTKDVGPILIERLRQLDEVECVFRLIPPPHSGAFRHP